MVPVGGGSGRPLRHSRGVAAFEFALGGSILILRLSMVVELDLILFTQSVLDNAAREAARLIRTGQIQRAGGSPAPFLAKICGDTATLVPAVLLERYGRRGG